MSLMQMLLGAGGRQNDATGGTITYSGDYQIHTFTSGGNFRVTLAGVPTAVVDVLVVGAGETGLEGSTNEEGDPPEISSNGGGGGNGGYGGRVISSATLTMSSFVLNTNYAVTVGTTNSASSILPYNGGSFTAAGAYTAGGGGGSPGATGTTGTASSITGTSVVYGSSGGGGGNGKNEGVGGTNPGGAGGTGAGNGGTGGASQNNGSPGDAATGYGGGGGGGGGAGGDGFTFRYGGAGGAFYQGVVILRFKYQNAA
jgi:hypothetical protein